MLLMTKYTVLITKVSTTEKELIIVIYNRLMRKWLELTLAFCRERELYIECVKNKMVKNSFVLKDRKIKGIIVLKYLPLSFEHR